MDKINNFIVLYQTREASASPYMHFSSCHIELVFASFTGMTLMSQQIGCPCKKAVLISIAFNFQFY